MVPKKAHQIQRELLQLIQHDQENQLCCDCRVSWAKTEQIWASLTFGAFLCIDCAAVHRQLGVQISRTKAVVLDTWSYAELVQMQQRGNRIVNENYCSSPDAPRLHPHANAAIREQWIRQKYLTQEFQHAAPPAPPTTPAPTTPARFIEYFVILGHDGSIGPTLQKEVNRCTNPSDLVLQPQVLDQYPALRDSGPLPQHITQFAFPQGYALTSHPVEPHFFSFVLTNVKGTKMYGCALEFYEELSPVEVISLFRRSSGEPKTKIVLPPWAQDDPEQDTHRIFRPKCCLILSHQPFLSLFRHFLIQLYRMSLSISPLPIERYIGNFVSEIPLPPRGRVQVQVTLPNQHQLVLARAPSNQLPSVHFSFRPLFQLLDVDNILLLWNALLLERKIVLCSKHLSVLHPVAETLMTLLLPLHWQGVYIPVLPSSLWDVLDAPIPYVIGVHADYLTSRSYRALALDAQEDEDRIFVDLDHNRIQWPRANQLPMMPERVTHKLKSKLNEIAPIFNPFATEVQTVDQAFQNPDECTPILPESSQGAFQSILAPVTKARYAGMSDGLTSPGKLRRNKPPTRKSSFTLMGTSLNNGLSSSSPSSSPQPAHRRKSSTSSVPEHTSSTCVSSSIPSLNSNYALVDAQENEAHDFSTLGIQSAFLRFFVKILKRYDRFLHVPAAAAASVSSASKTEQQRPPPPEHRPKPQPQDVFDIPGFVKDCNFEPSASNFLTSFCSSQMFERFCVDRIWPEALAQDVSDEIQFFTESIHEKLNHRGGLSTLSRKTTLWDTSFLDSTERDISETFLAPAPSTFGLAARRPRFCYPAFPSRLEPEHFGELRTPPALSEELESHTFNVESQDNRRSQVLTWTHTRRCVIQIQAQYRGHLQRLGFRQVQVAVRCIQRQWRHWKEVQRLHDHAVILQRYWKRYQHIRAREQTQEAVQVIYYWIIGTFRARQYQNRKNAMILIQSHVRQYGPYRRYRAQQQVVRWIQARRRGQKIRVLWQHQRALEMKELQHELVRLWQEYSIPLTYRSRFWTQWSHLNSFVALAQHRQERQHLQQLTCFSTRPPGGKKARWATLVHPLSGSSLQHTVSWKELVRQAEFEYSIQKDDIQNDNIQNVIHSIPMNGFKSSLPRSTKLEMYAQFGIALNTRRKKKQLLAKLWHPESAHVSLDASAEIIQQLVRANQEQRAISSSVEKWTTHSHHHTCESTTFVHEKDISKSGESTRV